MITLNKLKSEVQKLGGTVEVDQYHDFKSFQIVAPDGKQWADSNSKHIIESYWNAESKSAAIENAMQRVRMGLENWNAELNGEEE